MQLVSWYRGGVAASVCLVDAKIDTSFLRPRFTIMSHLDRTLFWRTGITRAAVQLVGQFCWSRAGRTQTGESREGECHTTDHLIWVGDLAGKREGAIQLMMSSSVAHRWPNRVTIFVRRYHNSFSSKPPASHPNNLFDGAWGCLSPTPAMSPGRATKVAPPRAAGSFLAAAS
jgi:hypothetical protein